MPLSSRAPYKQHPVLGEKKPRDKKKMQYLIRKAHWVGLTKQRCRRKSRKLGQQGGGARDSPRGAVLVCSQLSHLHGRGPGNTGDPKSIRGEGQAQEVKPG